MIPAIAPALLLGLAAVLGACSATATINQPLNVSALASSEGSISTGGYRSVGLAANGSSDQLMVVMASSGAGKRSAAFSYGVLRGLRAFEIRVDGRNRRLLDELDTIASVSGGSFPAAYDGLHRDKTFTDFEHDFLKQDPAGGDGREAGAGVERPCRLPSQPGVDSFDRRDRKYHPIVLGPPILLATSGRDAT